MRAVRHWSVRNARGLMRLYDLFQSTIVALEPVVRRIGYERLEKPVAAVEHVIKCVMFDCQMCGQCALSSTGMSCPMNCPKNLRNGPCGGVRADGNCEVKPDMPCVWVKAWAGAQAMKSENILDVQLPVDNRLKGRSSWLRIVREVKDGSLKKPASSARKAA